MATEEITQADKIDRALWRMDGKVKGYGTVTNDHPFWAMSAAERQQVIEAVLLTAEGVNS